MRNVYFTLLVSSCALSMGCGQATSFKNLPASIEQAISGSTSTNQCQMNIPQVLVSGNVNDFEFTGGFGLTFGFNPTGVDSVPVTGSASINVQEAQMDATFEATDLAGTFLASADVTSGQTSTNINATVDFSVFAGLSPTAQIQAFMSTPLATVTNKSLQTAMKSLVSGLAASHVAWIGHVTVGGVNNDSTLYMIDSGSEAGVQVGDQFDAYNVQTFWSGAPCTSTYEGSARTSTTPVATVTVVSVNTATAVAQVEQTNVSPTNPVNGQPQLVIQPGAEIQGHGLTHTLKFKAAVGSISSPSFTLPGGVNFDFANVLANQAPAIMSQDGFVITHQ